MLQSIERQRHLIDFTLSSLMRRKGKNFSVLFVYTLVVFLLASVMFFTSALRKEAHLVLTNAPEIIVQRSLSGRFSFIPVDYGKKLADIRGVVSVRERLWGYYYDPEFKANYTFMVPEKLPVEQGTIAIGAGISNTRHAYEGDILSFTSPDGVLRSYTVKSVLS